MTNSISTINSLPAIQSSESSFFQYLREIQKFPILTAEEEYEYDTSLDLPKITKPSTEKDPSLTPSFSGKITGIPFCGFFKKL